MIATRSLAVRAAVIALGAVTAAGLGGCISLFPKAPPTQLYEFGRARDDTASPSPVASPPGAAPTSIFLSTVSMPRAAQGDAILTLTGAQAAYIADARWVSPAAVMFQEDVERAFDQKAQRTQLLRRGLVSGATVLLRLDVLDFEARYDAGPGAAPVIVVAVRASLGRPDADSLHVQSFTAREPASDNRVGAIVAAFDRATDQVLGQVTAWTDATAPAEAAAPSPAATTSQTTTLTSNSPQR